MLFSMFLRSFFIQAGWNYERNQNVGFAFALLPALRKAYGVTVPLACPALLPTELNSIGQKGGACSALGGLSSFAKASEEHGPAKLLPSEADLSATERFSSALLRNLGFFNTQPYMAGFILGNVAKMEEKLAAGPENEEAIKTAAEVKQALASSFAAIGDRIFWGRLKPMTTQVCLIVWILGGFYGWLFISGREMPSLWLIMLGPVSGVAVYSFFAVYWRWKGVKLGFECGGASNCGLEAMNWSRFIRRLSVLGFSFSLMIVLAAFALSTAFNSHMRPGPDLALRLGLPLSVLAVHRVAHKSGRSVFFVIGLILSVSLFLFWALKLKPFVL
ncbi:MAG: hypothetical protein A2X34_07460 [Elusimicrobia bacterium GWC2_51_8]|nr:MAG: hypothetical protein A2X33_05395 [Elusimicrobia bacterium GWA2_51_34]OGR64262.1 MAG: hypothetical protein A2X34_07460 [Elusimicrobia bacterium GWC2_51_8]HAF96013.1 hypothetical protein [Elusimicrobiota bacterium]